MTDPMREAFITWHAKNRPLGNIVKTLEYGSPELHGFEGGWDARQPEIDALRTEGDALRKRIEDMAVDLDDLAHAWRLEAADLKRNGLSESAEGLNQCRNELAALARRLRRESNERR